jgi:hypothetical protein
MKRVVEYLASLDPAFGQGIEGAERSEIERLEQLSGGPLPPSYRDFLERMGRSLGKLRIEDADLRIERAIEFYAEDGPPLREGTRYLGKDGNYPFADYYLDAEREGAEPLVVRYSGEGPFTPPFVWKVYASLEEMLLVAAFTGIRMRALPERARCAPSGMLVRPNADKESPRQALQRVAAQLGFEPVAGTGPWSPCFERGDAAMRAYQPPPQAGMLIDVGARDREGLSLLLELLADHLALVPS